MSLEFIKVVMSRHSSVVVKTCYRLKRGFDYRQEQQICLYSTASRPALGPTQPPIQWVAGAPCTGVKRLVSEAGDSTPFSAKVKNGGDKHPLPHSSYGIVLN
jgi:hypothetical protein